MSETTPGRGWPRLETDAGFTEVGDRVWVARHTWFDVNVSVIGGERGLVVVDTHASDAAAGGVLDGVRALGAGEVVAVVNTHAHFDHTFGNDRFLRELGGPGVLPLHAHEDSAADTIEAGRRAQSRYEAVPPGSPDADEHRAEVLATSIVPATHTFSSAAVVDLGDRAVELVHPGRGHTAGDLVVLVPDAEVALLGDLVEESAARDGVPSLGPDCWPMDWPASLDLVLSLLSPSARVVPGHGTVVDRDFVQEQRADLGVVAETIRDLAGRGVPVGQALEAAEWPFPRGELADAVRRGYAHLPRSARSLPLI